MAVETREDVLAALQQVAPGARVTSGYRTPEHNRDVGGVPGSFHTRGSPSAPRALDIVPPEGMSMSQLDRRLAGSGLRLEELINEGDHVHVAFDGRPRAAGGGDGGGEVFESMGRRFSTLSTGVVGPDETPESLLAAGFEYDTERNSWFKVVDRQPPREPLADLYGQRQMDRESRALDAEGEEIEERARFVQAAMIPEPVVRDVARGLFVEGGQAALSGFKRGVNETLDAVDEAADWIERYVPGTVQWEGLDGDSETPFRIRLTTQNEAQDRLDTLQGNSPADREITGRAAGDALTFWQRLGSAQMRLPTNETERPTTVTGRFIEGAAQFGTGFAGGARVLRGWKTATTAGRIGKALAQGALADFTAFDGNEARLSNLLQDYAPEAAAPAFQWLAANEDDPELLGRAKNAIEGAGLGAAADLLMGGLRSLRGARTARRQAVEAAEREGLQVPPDLPRADAEVAGEAAEAQIREALGDPDAPLFSDKVARAERTTRRASRDLAEQTAAGAASDRNLFDVNLARINTPDDVAAVITGMADRFAADVDLARRASQSWDETRAAAGSIDWVQAMAARRRGDAVNAETALAYREAANASGAKVLDLARLVAAEPTLANQYAFRRGVAAHHAIQMELMGARAEAGRALNAFRIPAGTPDNVLRQIDDLMADAGGANSAQELAKKVMEAARRGDTALNEMIRGGAMARTRDAIRMAYTNGLLSGMGTPIINVAGNAAMLLQNVAARAVSPRLARAFGGQPSTQIGEASALIHGYQQALRDTFRMSPVDAARRVLADDATYWRQEGLIRGLAPGLDDAAPAGIKMRAEREEAGMRVGGSSRPLSAGAWRVDEDSVLGRVLDIAQMVVDAPSNLNALGDDFFKTLAARGELHAQAFRRVTAEQLEGEAARARMADLLQNPTTDMLSSAEREMHDLTFTRQTPGMAQAFMDLRRYMDSNPTPLPLGTMVLPFIRTPANLISMGMRYSPLAPFMRRFADDLAEGGARAETAKAQMAIGTALWSVWFGMAMDGQITGSGPANRAQRDALQRSDEFGGALWQPYSVRLGERWYSYERADPMGQGMGLVADLAELLNNSDWDGASVDGPSEVTAHAVAALGHAFFDKTMLSGATEFTSAMLSGGTPEAERLLQQRAASAIPFSAASRMMRRGDDPYLRETWDVVSAMRNTVPGLSDDLPMQRDLWGQPRTYQTGLGTVYDAVVPVRTKATGGSAIDLEILNNGVSVTMPQRSMSVGGIDISLRNRPDIYEELVRRAGQPAFEQLNAVVEGRHEDSDFYLSLSDGPDGGKAEYIRRVVSDYRARARGEVMDIYARDIENMVAAKLQRREEARAPR